MNLQHLKYAMEVARSRSISKAAENLYVSQPFLSKAIKELEEEFGISIFSRTPEGYSRPKRARNFSSTHKLF